MLLKEENRFLNALSMYATVLYYDINIELNSGIDIEDFLIAPALQADLIELKEYYDNRIIEQCFQLPNRIINIKF